MRRPAWVSFGLGALVFAGYAWLAPPSVFWLDSGELTSAGAALGVAHPTGFPLYLAAARLASLLPVGEIALRVTLLSALCAAVTVALVCRLVARTDESIGGGIGGACAGAVLAVALVFVRQATVAEIYAPTAALLALTLTLLTSVGAGADHRRGLALAVVVGLGLGCHGSYRLLVFWPYAAVLVIRLRHGARWPLLAPVLTLGVAAAVHAYLPVRSLHAAAGLDWGHTHGIGAFFDHVRASSIFQTFRDQMFATHVERWGTNASTFFDQVGDSLGPVAVVLALVGLAWLPRRDRRGAWLGVTLIVWIVADAIYAVWINPMGLTDLQNGTPLVVAASIACGCGVVALSRFVGRMGPVVAVAVSAVAVIPAALVGIGRVAPSGRGDAPLRWAEAALEQAPPRATLLVTGDSTAAPLLYATTITGARPDTVVLVRQMWRDRERTRALWTAAGRAGPAPDSVREVLAAGPALWEPAGDKPPPPFALRADAPLFRVVRRPASLRPNAAVTRVTGALRALLAGADAADPVARRVGSQALAELGAWAVSAGSLEAAERALKAAVVVDPTHARAWNNRGAVASRRGDLDAAIRFTEVAARVAPNDAGIHINLARYYLATHAPEKAATHAHLATVLAPRRAAAWALASEAARARGDLEAAERDARRAREIDPEDRDVRALP